MAAKPTKAQLLAKLADLGVEAPKKATISELQALVEDAEAAPEAAEEAVEAVEEAEIDLKTVKCGEKRTLNVRLGPSKCAPVIRTLQNGEKVAVLSVENDWARLEHGFCMAEYLV